MEKTKCMTCGSSIYKIGNREENQKCADCLAVQFGKRIKAYDDIREFAIPRLSPDDFEELESFLDSKIKSVKSEILYAEREQDRLSEVHKAWLEN